MFKQESELLQLSYISFLPFMNSIKAHALTELF